MYDVIIVGSGGAGLSAALNAKKSTEKVLVISKTYPTHSQTCQAQGGINAVLKCTRNDNTEEFFNDTKKASHKLSNNKHIKFLCEESEKTINWLDSIAVPFSRNDEKNIAQRKFGGTKAKRTCFSSDYTGLKILHTLYDQCLKENIEFKNENQLINLIVEESKVKGITVLELETGEIKELYAKSLILATGGYAGLYYGYTTNSYSSTGDGIAAALRAGAKLSNMEFIQFHPTALENKNILISESARGEGGYLVDDKNNRFIDELKPRDEVARAIYERNIKNQKVFLDLRHLGKERLLEAMPQEVRLIKEFAKLDMVKDLVPINPSAHYCMGGILTDFQAKTNLENLYACGECAQSGIHGANRLGGNSLLEIITYGKVAGENAAKNARNIQEVQKEDTQVKKDQIDIEKILEKESNIDFYSKKEKLGKTFFEDVGLFRDKKKLLNALDLVDELKKELEYIGINDKSRIYNKNLSDFIEYKNLIEIAEIVVISALKRKESRGAHYRTDFLEESNNFDKYSNVILKDNTIEHNFEEIL